MYGAGGGGGEYKCDGVIYADQRSRCRPKGLSPEYAHRVGGSSPGGLSPAFGVDHSTEQPKP